VIRGYKVDGTFEVPRNALDLEPPMCMRRYFTYQRRMKMEWVNDICFDREVNPACFKLNNEGDDVQWLFEWIPYAMDGPMQRQMAIKQILTSMAMGEAFKKAHKVKRIAAGTFENRVLLHVNDHLTAYNLDEVAASHHRLPNWSSIIDYFYIYVGVDDKLSLANYSDDIEDKIEEFRNSRSGALVWIDGRQRVIF
jgi:hypothetical protein